MSCDRPVKCIHNKTHYMDELIRIFSLTDMKHFEWNTCRRRRFWCRLHLEFFLKRTYMHFGRFRDIDTTVYIFSRRIFLSWLYSIIWFTTKVIDDFVRHKSTYMSFFFIRRMYVTYTSFFPHSIYTFEDFIFSKRTYVADTFFFQRDSETYPI